MINTVAELMQIGRATEPPSEAVTAGLLSAGMSVQHMQTMHQAFVTKKGKHRVKKVIEEATGSIDETDAWMIYCQQMAMRGIKV